MEAMTVGDAIDIYQSVEEVRSARKDRKDTIVHNTFVKADEFFSVPPPPIKWLVQGIMEDKTFVVLGGEPKTSKSWLALELGLSVASGTSAFGSEGFATNGQMRSVAMIMLEDSQHNVYARMRSLGRAKGMYEDDLAKLPMFFRFRRGLDLTDYSDIEWLIKSVKDNVPECALIVIDPMRNAHTAEENDSKGISLLCDNIRDVRDSTGATVLLTHHLRKPTSQDQDTPGNALRGSGALYGAIDGLVGMVNRRQPEDVDLWRNNVYIRVKAGREAQPFQVVLRVQDGSDGRACKAWWELSAITPDEKKRKKS